MQCPSDTREPSDQPASTGFTDYWYNAGLSWNLTTATGSRNFATALNEATLLFPTLTVMNGDGNSGPNNLGRAPTRTNGNGAHGEAGGSNVSNPGTFGAENSTATNIGLCGGGDRHLEGINLSFADGHVKWYKSANGNTTPKLYVLDSSFDVSGQNPTLNINCQSSPCY